MLVRVQVHEQRQQQELAALQASMRQQLGAMQSSMHEQVGALQDSTQQELGALQNSLQQGLAAVQGSLSQTQQGLHEVSQSVESMGLDERLQTLEEGFGDVHHHTDKLDSYINTMLKDMMSLANQGSSLVLTFFNAAHRHCLARF